MKQLATSAAAALMLSIASLPGQTAHASTLSCQEATAWFESVMYQYRVVRRTHDAGSPERARYEAELEYAVAARIAACGF